MRFKLEKESKRKALVGTGRFELPACRLGGGRSIQLSYVPSTLQFTNAASLFAQYRGDNACLES
jgi:hypothetical protein